MKKITLSNGESVNLIFNDSNSSSYVIEAYNQSNTRVGYCYFSITKKYERDLTEDELAMLRRVCSNPKKTSTLVVDKSNKDHFQIANDILYYINKGKVEEFHLTSAKCRLELISVEQEQFSNVGLGTAMFKEMEEIALKEKCTQIYATYEPYGAFAESSPYFYQKNGFRIYFDLKKCAVWQLKIYRKIQKPHSQAKTLKRKKTGRFKKGVICLKLEKKLIMKVSIKWKKFRFTMEKKHI